MTAARKPRPIGPRAVEEGESKASFPMPAKFGPRDAMRVGKLVGRTMRPSDLGEDPAFDVIFAMAYLHLERHRSDISWEEFSAMDEDEIAELMRGLDPKAPGHTPAS